uniref:Phosphoglucosamine mutase n=1 Tax=Anthurium amnicola TaxID=1678845 RepID=A0A1D1XSE4_9ARAE
MDPQTFIRLSIGSMGLRFHMTALKAIQTGGQLTSSPCSCEIRLRGFPVQTVVVPWMSSPEANPDPHSNPAVFYLGESDVKALMVPGCFPASKSCLEITVYMQRQGSHCGISSRKQLLGTFRLDVGPEWSERRSVLLHNGWTGLGKNRQEEGKQGPELHLRVKLDPDPRYVFQFEDETALSPQIVQLQGTIKQPIFSCKFSRERRASQLDPMSSYWSNSNSYTDQDSERRERKGWRVMIHDLSGSAVAAAFMTTPFVPSTGSDRVARSNPGAWLILRPDPVGPPESWHPWGRLEAWRESGARESVCCRLHLLPEGQESGVLVSQILISTDKGGEFFIDMDRQAPVGIPVPSVQGICRDYFATSLHGPVAGGFVMNCRVQGEGKSSKPLVQLAMRHVTCVEDAAIFVALAAAVDLSIVACRPFRRKAKRIIHSSF